MSINDYTIFEDWPLDPPHEKRLYKSAYGFDQNPDKPSTKSTNPKDAIGSTKLPMHLVPSTVNVAAAMAFAEGASKYGAYNWRVAGVRVSIYMDALMRHAHKYWNGENTDPITGVPHMASVIACAGILIDAAACGKLNDDRPPIVDLAAEIARAEEIVRSVVKLNAHHTPHHHRQTDRELS